MQKGIEQESAYDCYEHLPDHHLFEPQQPDFLDQWFGLDDKGGFVHSVQELRASMGVDSNESTSRLSHPAETRSHLETFALSPLKPFIDLDTLEQRIGYYEAELGQEVPNRTRQVSVSDLEHLYPQILFFLGLPSGTSHLRHEPTASQHQQNALGSLAHEMRVLCRLADVYYQNTSFFSALPTGDPHYLRDLIPATLEILPQQSPSTPQDWYQAYLSVLDRYYGLLYQLPQHQQESHQIAQGLSELEAWKIQIAGHLAQTKESQTLPDQPLLEPKARLKINSTIGMNIFCTPDEVNQEGTVDFKTYLIIKGNPDQKQSEDIYINRLVRNEILLMQAYLLSLTGIKLTEITDFRHRLNSPQIPNTVDISIHDLTKTNHQPLHFAFDSLTKDGRSQQTKITFRSIEQQYCQRWLELFSRAYKIIPKSQLKIASHGLFQPQLL